MANTASNNSINDESDHETSKKAEQALKKAQGKVGSKLFENIGNLKTDISDSNLADSSSTATGVNSKRKLSFEDEIYDPADFEKYLIKNALFLFSETGCKSDIAQKIKSIRLEPRDSDAPLIQKKLKPSEKKVINFC
jgi:hypothetical protein